MKILEDDAVSLADHEFAEPRGCLNPDVGATGVSVARSSRGGRVGIRFQLRGEEESAHIQRIERVTHQRPVGSLNLDGEFLESCEGCGIIDFLALHEFRNHGEVSAISRSVV